MQDTDDPEDVLVRPAVPGDAAGVARVHVRGWQVGYRGLLPDTLLDGLDVARREGLWHDRLATGAGDAASGRVDLVAVRGTTVLGFASVGPCRDDDQPPGTGELWALYVDPDRWGAGAGGALDRAARDVLRTAGLAPVTLWVLSDNTRARRFYEARGWRVDGATRTDHHPGNHPGDPPVALVETRYAVSPEPGAGPPPG